MKLLRLLLIAGLSASLLAGQIHAEVDSRIPEYRSKRGIAGSITSTGSDTLANLMTFWTEEFKSHYPAVQTTVNSAGSSTAPPSLTTGSSTLGPMSRKMKSKELAAFEKKFGYRPTPIPVALDALAVFVHRKNPIKGLSIAELDAIFSNTRNCGYNSAVSRWSDVKSASSLSSTWKKRKLALYGRNSASGTYGYFKKVAMCKGDFKPHVNEQGGSAAVVQAIGKKKNAIGYSGIGYLTSRVRALPLSKFQDGAYVEPTTTNAMSGEYPLSRHLFIYVNLPPGRKLPILEREFIRLILSQSGQAVVEKSGYVPLPYTTIIEYLKKI